MIKIILSRKLGEIRMKQSELARITKIRPSTINDLYNDMTPRVNLDQIDIICDALDCDLTDIFERTPNKEPRTLNYRNGQPKKD